MDRVVPAALEDEAERRGPAVPSLAEPSPRSKPFDFCLNDEHRHPSVSEGCFTFAFDDSPDFERRNLVREPLASYRMGLSNLRQAPTLGLRRDHRKCDRQRPPHQSVRKVGGRQGNVCLTKFQQGPRF